MSVAVVNLKKIKPPNGGFFILCVYTIYMKLIVDLTEEIKAAQKTYQGKKRSDLKDSDFLFPKERSFPIVTPSDIADAISNFGRMKSNMSYEAFLKKLYDFAKKKGAEFIKAFPEASKQKLGIKD